MRRKKEGDTLAEKIHKHLEKMKEKELVSLLGDAFFSEEKDSGIQFYVRRTNLMREARTLHILDEIEEKLKKDQAF